MWLGESILVLALLLKSCVAATLNGASLVENQRCCRGPEEHCLDWAFQYSINNPAEIVGMDTLGNRYYTNIDIRNDGTAELFSLNDPVKYPLVQVQLSTSLTSKPYQVTKAKAVLMDLVEIGGVTDEFAMLIAIKFIGKLPSSMGEPQEYLGFLGVEFTKAGMQSYKFNAFAMEDNKEPLQPTDRCLDLYADKKIGRLYYTVPVEKDQLIKGCHGMPDLPRLVRSSLHWVQSVDLTRESTEILFNSPNILTVKDMEIAFGQYRRSRLAHISSFNVCNCRVAVGSRFSGRVFILCCHSLRSCGVIKPPCRPRVECGRCERHPCLRFVYPLDIQWCCRCVSEKENQLWVRYQIVTICKMGEHHEDPRSRSRTIIRSFAISTETDAPACRRGTISEDSRNPCDCYASSSESCTGETSAAAPEPRKQEWIRLLYSIKGCKLVNFIVCCQGECPIVYGLIKVREQYYLRAYSGSNGKIFATVRLGGSPSLFMALAPQCPRGHGSCHDSYDRAGCCSRSVSSESSEHHGPPCRHCCKCGVLIPFKVLNAANVANAAGTWVVTKFCARER